MRARLADLVDFDRLNGGEIRLSIAATDVESGEPVIFDSSQERIVWIMCSRAAGFYLSSRPSKWRSPSGRRRTFNQCPARTGAWGRCATVGSLRCGPLRPRWLAAPDPRSGAGAQKRPHFWKPDCVAPSLPVGEQAVAGRAPRKRQSRYRCPVELSARPGRAGTGEVLRSIGFRSGSAMGGRKTRHGDGARRMERGPGLHLIRRDRPAG